MTYHPAHQIEHQNDRWWLAKAFSASALGALGVVAFAAFWLWAMPVHAAYHGSSSACHGSSVIASYYGSESGNRTATGDYFDGSSMTAAMPSRKHLGERWRVSYRGRSVVVLVNDLGPKASLGRGIDLSKAAARKLGLIGVGVGRVCVERLS